MTLKVLGLLTNQRGVLRGIGLSVPQVGFVVSGPVLLTPDPGPEGWVGETHRTSSRRFRPDYFTSVPSSYLLDRPGTGSGRLLSQGRGVS